PPNGRMRLVEGKKGSFILDDTYNSSPAAAEQAIQTVKELTGHGKKIIVLGDMLELGQFSVREHERMGELAASSCDILMTLGLRSRKIAAGALDHGMSEKNIFQYDDIDRAGKELLQMIEPNDVILVKASQGIRAEKIVERLMLHPEDARKLLVRQSKAWSQR
ncbi:MAG: UDP-N-acetylmuramoyl-tripeptide--D-alanyl-D-alanine ligase, partial [Patiriisocius sp.]